MIRSVNAGGVVDLNCSFALAYRGFNIQIRRHGRLGHLNRFGKPGPSGFVVLHEPVRKDEPTKPDFRLTPSEQEAKRAAEKAAKEVLVARFLEMGFTRYDLTDPPTLRPTPQAYEHELAYEGYSLRVAIRDDIGRAAASLRLDPEDYFLSLTNGSAYFDNMHLHNFHVIESLHDLLREAKKAIDCLLRDIERLSEKPPIFLLAARV